MLRDELADRVARGVAVVQNERRRLVWDNLPVWYELRNMSKLLASEGFNIVVTTYTNGWAETAPLFDERDPIGSAARVYSRVFINRGQGHRKALLQGLARDWGCDGVLLHSNRSCKPYSVGQLDMAGKLSEGGLRTLVLEADHLDARSYSRQQIEGRLSAFMESFE
jgi:benzoyl-CoA reductase/2-hydroxyglutaryl-CoA dehydratase subunit BcrC/BadD/HgdB